MNLTAIFILATCLAASAAGNAQNISISVKNAPLEKVFSEIRKQTTYTFVYTRDDLKNSSNVTLQVSNIPVNEVLQLALRNQPLTFTIVDKVVIIKEKPQPPVSTGGGSPPITGVVRGPDGQPLAGVNVMIKGTKKGTVTDKDGRFTIEAEEGSVLEISSIGFGKKEIRVYGTDELIIALDITSSVLDEVQVIPYGTTTSRLSTSNIATVKAKDIEKQPVNNPLLALQGRVPGLVITQATGMPGSAVTVRIQGQNSIGNGNDPLYVIDGVPYQSQNLQTFQGSEILGRSVGNQSGVSNPLNYINPADIESIDILKDADATAIYGSRAANGAILISTKKGKIGEIKMDINVQQGWGKVGNFMDLMNSQQYLEMRNEALKNDNIPVQSSDYDLNGLWDTTRYTDWQKTLIGGTAQYSQYSASVSGGTTNMQYLVGGTYHKETTVFPGDFSDKKGSIHFNINSTSVNHRFRFQFSGSYMSDKSNLPGADLTSSIFLAPVAPALYTSDGTLNWAPNAAGSTSWGFYGNPLAKLYNLFDTKASNLLSNSILSYRLLPGLELKSSFGYTSLVSNQFSSPLIQSTPPESRPNFFRYAIFSFNTAKTWIIEPQLNYQKTLGKGKMELLLGSTIQQQDNEGQQIFATGQPNDQLLRNISAATTIYPYSADISTYKYNAGFGRLNFNWTNKYIINITARRDGSSRFGDKNKFHNFASVGGAWIFGEEELIRKAIPFLSFGKLRGSYGSTGSDQINNYQYLNLYYPLFTGTTYQGGSSLETYSLPNPYLQWEETRKLQMGLDFGFLNNRILANATYVHNRSSNQLLSYNLPYISGLSGVTSNFPALVQNTAWEFTLLTENVQLKDFKWTSSLNLTIPRNKLVSFPGLDSSSYNNQLAIGQPLEEGYSFRSFRFYGVEQTTGIYQVYDQHGSPTTSPSYPGDATVFISSKPKFYGGFQNSLSFKGFQLDFMFQFTKQKYFDFLYTSIIPGNFQYGRGNQPVNVLSRWQKPGDVTTIQRFSSDFSLYAYNSGDQTIQDVSYIKLKNISFSYQVPNRIMNIIHIKSTRVFMHAQNVFTITNYKGLDPESFSIYSLPPLRVITVGVQVGL